MNPSRINRVGYKDSTNGLLEGSTKETLKEDNKFFKKYGTISDTATYTIQLRLGKPVGVTQEKKTEMNTLVVFTCKSHSKLSLELMQDIVTLITTKSEIKSVPVILEFDKTIKDNTMYYNKLLQ
eukprot:8335305-Ditylum_brightwellii.AAC.1